MRRRFSIPAALLVVTTASFGCRRDDAKPALVSDAAAPDAATVAVAADAAPASIDASDGAVDLLHLPGAAVAVSSNVDNPRDYPEHLVDGREDTAWNGRSGDLVGGWIAFKVPAAAHVTRVEMSAGFDKTNSDGDLFTMNHRIKRVRIERDGKPVKEHTFDVNVRTPQSIALDTAGGSFRITILETLAGSKATWREACVSELHVLGTPAPGTTAKVSAAAPSVGIGSFPGGATATDLEPGAAEAALTALLGRGWPSIAAFCQAWDAVIGPVLDHWIKEGGDIIPKKHGCVVMGPMGAGFTPTADVKSVTRIRVFQENWSEERYAIETPAGFFVPVADYVDAHNFSDPGCFGSTQVTVKSVRANGAGVDTVISRRWKNRRYSYYEDGGVEAYSNSDDLSTEQQSCAIDGSKMQCAKKITQRVCHIDTSEVPCDSF